MFEEKCTLKHNGMRDKVIQPWSNIESGTKLSES